MPLRSQQRQAAACAGLILLAASAPPGALAQLRVRARSTTTVQLIQLRPFTLDTATGTLAGGTRQTATPLVQDLEATAWGLGVRGLRIHGLVRLRGTLGSDLIWPRSDDHADALWAFVELERATWRLRAGRIQQPTPIVLTTYDGAAALWRPRPWLRAEGYGGRSLVRALHEPATSSAIASIDPFVPSTGTLVTGVSAWAEPDASVALGLAWQREVASDLSALVNHQAAVQARWNTNRLALSGSAVFDLASSDWGRARLSAVVTPRPAVSAEAAVFRYRPIFPLNTIGGAFSPQGHWGLSLAASAPLERRLLARASYVMRRYQPTTVTTPFLTQLDDATHTLSLGATATSGAWQARGAYLLNLGYGGEHSGFELAAGKTGERWDLSLQVAAFQESEELRVASGTVYGLGASGRYAFSGSAAVRGQITRYQHERTRGSSAPDWSQLRGMLTLEVGFGADGDRSGRP